MKQRAGKVPEQCSDVERITVNDERFARQPVFDACAGRHERCVHLRIAPSLAERKLAGRQAERFGAELLILNGVSRGHLEAGAMPVADLASGDTVSSDIVIVAPGMEWRRLQLDGVEELLGHGVYYGAGRSEAVQCSGEHVAVVGAGNSAGQAVMNLANAGART